MALLGNGCVNTDILCSPHYIRYKAEVAQEEGTRATLVTTENLHILYDEMTVKGVRRNTSASVDDVLFTDTFVPDSTGSSALSSQTWQEDSYVFYSYPSKHEIEPTFKDNGITFDVAIYNDSSSTDDLILARTSQTRDKDVKFTYKHIFTAVNVIYRKTSIGHKITSIKIKNTPTAGTCRMADDGVISWSNFSYYTDLTDDYVRYATMNNQEITEDGYKFMTLPGNPITLEVVIDGFTLTSTCAAKKAGEIVNFYIDDNIEIQKEDGSKAEGEIVQNPDGTYRMTLNTYVTGEYKTVMVPKPMDFILVLDMSESMTTSGSYKAKSSYRVPSVTTHTYNDWNKSGAKYYAKLNGTSYQVKCAKVAVSGGQYLGEYISYVYWAYIEDNNNDRYYITLDGSLIKSSCTSPSLTNIPTGTYGYKIMPVRNPAWPLWGEATLTTTSTQTKESGLKDAVIAFIDEVEKQAKNNGVEHRVAIIDLKNNKFPVWVNKDQSAKNYIIDGTLEYLYQCFSLVRDTSGTYDNNNTQPTGVLYPFRNVLETNSAQGLRACLGVPKFNGITATDYAMYMATLVSKQFRNDVGKTVIVFTDGKPTHAGSSIQSRYVIPGYYSSGTLTDSQVADGAVAFSKQLKDAGAKVYSVGIFNSSDKPATGFMDALSSNYPNATSVSNKGEGGDNGYYQDATNADLASIFEKIAKTSAEASIDIHSGAYVTAIVSDAFVLPEDYIEGSGNMTFYEVNQTGYDDAKKQILWSSSPKDITSQITCTMDKVTQSITITGFDYGKKFCVTSSAGPFTGSKLVMVFDALVANPEKEGTGTNQATEFTTGLYDDNGKPVTMFDPIYVNL